MRRMALAEQAGQPLISNTRQVRRNATHAYTLWIQLTTCRLQRSSSLPPENRQKQIRGGGIWFPQIQSLLVISQESLASQIQMQNTSLSQTPSTQCQLSFKRRAAQALS